MRHTTGRIQNPAAALDIITGAFVPNMHVPAYRAGAVKCAIECSPLQNFPIWSTAMPLALAQSQAHMKDRQGQREERINWICFMF